MIIQVEKKHGISMFTEKNKNEILRGEWLWMMIWSVSITFYKIIPIIDLLKRGVCNYLIQYHPYRQMKSIYNFLYSSLSRDNANYNWLLYGRGYWVCSYYDRKNIFIYDSLNNKRLEKDHEQFLKKLFPSYDFIQNSVQFPTVQQQPNGSDCGVFAIVFVII